MRSKIVILILIMVYVLSHINRPQQPAGYAMNAQFKKTPVEQKVNQANIISEDYFLDIEIGEENYNQFNRENISAGHTSATRYYYLGHSILTHLDLPPPVA